MLLNKKAIKEKRFIRAIQNKDIKKMKKIINSGFDVNFNGYQAIIICLNRNYVEGLELLLSSGANVNVVADKLLAKTLILESKYIEMLKLIIAYGWNVQSNNNSAIRIAGIYFNYEIVKLLIENGADVTSNNNEPLYIACLYKNYDVVDLLIKSGADMYMEDNNIIKWNIDKDEDIIRIFVNNGYHADKNIIDYAKKIKADEEIIKLLESTIK